MREAHLLKIVTYQVEIMGMKSPLHIKYAQSTYYMGLILLKIKHISRNFFLQHILTQRISNNSPWESYIRTLSKVPQSKWPIISMYKKNTKYEPILV